MILNHQVSPTRKGRGFGCGRSRYRGRGRGRRRRFRPCEIIRTFTKNESGRVIKGKQKKFAIDTAKKRKLGT